MQFFHSGSTIWSCWGNSTTTPLLPEEQHVPLKVAKAMHYEGHRAESLVCSGTTGTCCCILGRGRGRRLVGACAGASLSCSRRSSLWGKPLKNKKRDLLPCGQSSLAPPHPHPATPHPLILIRIHYVSDAVVTMYKFLSASGQEIFSPWLSITLICFPFLYQESLYSVCTSYSEGDHEGVSVGTGCSNFESLLLRHIWEPQYSS